MPTETPPPQPEPESTGQRVAKNAVIYLLSQLASWVVTFASVSAIPRLLGKQALGQLAIADTVVTTVVTFGCLSIEQYLIVEIGRNRNETERLLRATLGLRIALLPLLCLSILAGLWVMGASPTVWVIGWLHIARVGVGFLALPFRSAVAGWEDARRVAAIDFVAVASPLLAVPLLWKGYSLLAIPVVALLTTTLLYGGLSLWISRRVNLRPIFDFALWKTICKGGTAFFANEMVAQIYGFTTVYMLKRLTLDEGTVGVYSQAIRLQGTFLFVPVAIGTALLPSLARLADASATEFQNTQRRVTVIMIATSLPVAALVFLLAHPFCHLLYGSRALAEVPDVLQISALNMIPLYLSSVLYRFLVAQRKNGVWSLFLGGTVILNAVLCWLFIPYAHTHWHNGSLGASGASLIAECCTMVFAFLLLKLNPFTPQTIKQIGKAVFATGCMTVVILLTRSLFILVPATLGMAVFLLVAWKLQVLGAEEQSKLRDLVSRKLGRFAGRKRSPS